MLKVSLAAGCLALSWLPALADSPEPDSLTYQEARWHPLHFKPAILTAADEQCLACHREILEHRVRSESPAGVKTEEALAWYQTLDTYAGAQETLHRRHLVTDFANRVMDLKCNTCHVGNDPREETAMSHAGGDPTLVQRKHVDPDVCLLCHGRFAYEYMGVPGPWPEYGQVFQNDCLICHNQFRTNRHQVNYLKPESIEALAKEEGKQDVCFGCHGGRAWYRISYPYPRHPWPGMAEAVPEWAEGRPTESEPRFLIGVRESPSEHEHPVEPTGDAEQPQNEP